MKDFFDVLAALLLAFIGLAMAVFMWFLCIAVPIAAVVIPIVWAIKWALS